MKPLQFWGSDALEIELSKNGKYVMITWIPAAGGPAKIIRISVDQLPQVIAYMTDCLREMQKPQEA